MVIALTQPTEDSTNPYLTLDKDKLQLVISLSATISLTAEQSKRKLTRFLMDEISLLITPHTPLLAAADQEAIFWRFPIVFSMGRLGKLGQVGEIDVDARSGDLVINQDLIEGIKTHARILAKSTTLPAND